MKMKTTAFLAFMILCGCFAKEEVQRFHNNKYEIVKPASWGIMNDLNPEAAIGMGNPFVEAYLIVLVEPKSDFPGEYDLEEYGEIVTEHMRTTCSKFEKSAAKDMQLNGMNAKKYVIDAVFEGIPIKYWIFTFDSGDDFGQLVVWSLPTRFKENESDFRKAIHSFVLVNL